MQPVNMVTDLLALNQPNNISQVCCCHFQIVFVSDSCSLILSHKKITLTLCGKYEKSELLNAFASICIWPVRTAFNSYS